MRSIHPGKLPRIDEKGAIRFGQGDMPGNMIVIVFAMERSAQQRKFRAVKSGINVSRPGIGASSASVGIRRLDISISVSHKSLAPLGRRLCRVGQFDALDTQRITRGFRCQPKHIFIAHHVDRRRCPAHP